MLIQNMDVCDERGHVHHAQTRERNRRRFLQIENGKGKAALFDHGNLADHVMRQATKAKLVVRRKPQRSKRRHQLTVNVLKVLRDEIGDASLLKRQISSPSKVSEIRERAVVDAKSIVDITNAFLDVPKYNDRVTNAVLQVCAEARSVKEAKAIVEEYFAMLGSDDPLMKGADDRARDDDDEQ